MDEPRLGHHNVRDRELLQLLMEALEQRPQCAPYMGHAVILPAGHLDVLKDDPQVIGVLGAGVEEAAAQYDVLKKVDDVFAAGDRIVILRFNLRLGFLFRANHAVNGYGDCKGQHRQLVVLLSYDEPRLTQRNTNTLTARTCLQAGGHGCVHVWSHGHARGADLDSLVAPAHEDSNSYCRGSVVESHGAGAVSLESEAASSLGLFTLETGGKALNAVGGTALESSLHGEGFGSIGNTFSGIPTHLLNLEATRLVGVGDEALADIDAGGASWGHGAAGELMG